MLTPPNPPYLCPWLLGTLVVHCCCVLLLADSSIGPSYRDQIFLFYKIKSKWKIYAVLKNHSRFKTNKEDQRRSRNLRFQMIDLMKIRSLRSQHIDDTRYDIIPYASFLQKQRKPLNDFVKYLFSSLFYSLDHWMKTYFFNVVIVSIYGISKSIHVLYRHFT